MRKRSKEYDDMEITQLRNDLNKLSELVIDMKDILGGSAAFEYKGLRADVRDLKANVASIQLELEEMKREKSFINLKTLKSKAVIFITVLGMAITIIKTAVDLWNGQ